MNKENPYHEKLKEVLGNVEQLNALQEEQNNIANQEINNMPPGEQKDKMLGLVSRINECKANKDTKGLQEIQQELKQFI